MPGLWLVHNDKDKHSASAFCKLCNIGCLNIPKRAALQKRHAEACAALAARMHNLSTAECVSAVLDALCTIKPKNEFHIRPGTKIRKSK